MAIAEEHAGARRVVRVDVEIGQLRQVVPDALRFAFKVVASGTVVEGAELGIEQVPVEGLCRRCAARTTLERFPFACAECGALDLEIVNGEQLSVEALELIDERPAYAEAT